MRAGNTRLTLGTLAPLTLLAALVADGGSRFFSYDGVCFRAWEALTRGGPNGLGGQFAPNRHYVNDHASGDLSGMGNDPAMRQYHREVFTTDAFGFRNPPSAVAATYDLVLVGTSFAAGSSVSDDQTLSARLGEALGRPVYNATGAPLGNERHLTALLERLRMTRGLVISEYMEASPPPEAGAIVRAPRGAAPGGLEARLGARAGQLRRARALFNGWTAESPLKLLLYKGFKEAQDDVILPNRFADLVVRDRLTNGDPILFEASQVTPDRPAGAAAGAVAGWRAFADMLRDHGLGLLIVLVPSQYRVYGPLVEHPRAGTQDDSYFGEIGRGLQAAGLPFLDLTPLLTGAARDGLAARHYFYWRDDTHWNADGIALSARAIAVRLAEMRRAEGGAPSVVKTGP